MPAHQAGIEEVIAARKNKSERRARMKIAIPTSLFFLALMGAHLVSAQSSNNDSAPTPDRTYQLLREDEDWSFLRDRAPHEDFWDPIKYIPLRNGVDDWYLTIGGEAREVWQQIGNDNWGQSAYWNAYFDERYVLFFDAHYGKHIRSFVELKSGLSSFRIGGPRPIDEKKLDFQAAFFEVGSSEGSNWINFRVGRQEMHYGSGRLIDCREGPNVRLSFDGFMVKSKINSWKIDGFALRPDVDNFGFFNNVPDHTVGFWGVYATRPAPQKVSVDVYYLGLDRKQATFERGTAQEVRHSLGARISRPIAKDKPGWDFNYEALWQFGTFGSDNIRAWSIASETSYGFPTVRLKPRFIARADISSGDNPNSKTLGVYVSPDQADNFVRGFVGFAQGKVVADDKRADAGEIGRAGETYRRIRITSLFGNMQVLVTDGHLPYPFGHELTGYQVQNLGATLDKAKAAGAKILSAPYTTNDRSSAIVQFPGGYIAEVHSLTSR